MVMDLTNRSHRRRIWCRNQEGSIWNCAAINFVSSPITSAYSNGIATIEITDVVGGGSGSGATTLNDLTDVVSSGAQINDIEIQWIYLDNCARSKMQITLNWLVLSIDLQIWHDESSYINESGTGSLFIDSIALFLQNAGKQNYK